MDKSRASDGRWTASRRTLLGLGVAAGADLVLAPWRRAWAGEHRQGRALVVGAGMSGLGAARTLADAGWQVTVLEARERIGGRVWTDRSLGLPLDLGGQWIEGATANPMAALARRYGLVTKVDADEWLYFGRDGKPISAAESDANAAEIQKLVGRVVAYGETLDRDVSWRQAVEHVLAGDTLSERRRDLVEQFLVGLETTWSGDTDALSLWHGDAAESFGGDNLLLPEGYGQIADRLAAGLDVRLGQVVSAIAQHDDGVRVEAGGKTFEADQVIVTVPLGVLKRQAIRFSPALPRAKSSAIERVGFGLLDKVVLVFERPFWPPGYDDFGHLDARPGRYAEILSWQRAGGQPVLFAFAAAAFAREMEELSDTAVVAEAMRVVRKLFGSKAPEPRRSKVVRWGKDPFAYGSYSFLAVGATPADLDSLAEPFGRVAFAGEATNRDHQASVHGAYLSGVREAQRLMAGS